MAIINLGTLGEPRKSRLAGVSEFTSELAKTKTAERIETRAEAGRERRSVRQAGTARAGQETQAVTSREGFATQLKVAALQIESKQETEDKAMWTKQLTHIADNPKALKQLQGNPEALKEFQKTTKRIMGADVFNPDGSIAWEGFTTQNRMTTALKQKEFDLTQKLEDGTINKDEAFALRTLKGDGADAVARKIINAQGFQEDLQKSSAAILNGANPQEVFRRIATKYPAQSAELKRILIPDTRRDFKITSSDVKAVERSRGFMNMFTEILKGPGAQTTKGKEIEALREKQVAQFSQ